MENALNDQQRVAESMHRRNEHLRRAERNPWVIDLYREWEKIVGANRPNGGIASFFPATSLPNRQHSATYTRKKDEKVFSTCTIDDVVRWSKTLRGGVQGGFDFMFEDDDAHAPCQMGYCE